MRAFRHWGIVVSLLISALIAAPAAAQQTAPATPTVPPKPVAKPKPKPKPAPAAEKPEAKPAAPAAAATAAAGGAKPTLLGQYGDWGAYTALPAGKKVCFALAKPAASETTPPGRPRNPSFMFISTRPSDKVSNEISIIIGYPFKPGSEATADVGGTSFALYTQQDGAWIKNASDESHMIDAMRGGQSAVVKGTSAKGTQSSDTFSLKGLAQALDRTGQECK